MGSLEPVVSVVLPTHNRAAELPRALDSVLAQSMTNMQVIVVDDASTDDTPAVLHRYQNDSRVQCVRAEQNLGGGGARNLGIELASAPLVAFQDSDDYWLPHKLEAQLAALEEHPECGLVYCGSLYYADQRSYYLPSPNHFDHFSGDMTAQVLKASPVSTQTLIVRRTLLDDDLFDPSFKRFQDWDLVIRLAQRTPFSFVDEPLVIINHTEQSISSVSINDAIYRQRVLDKYPDQFALSPNDLCHHHYVCARVFHKHGKRKLAAEHYQSALRYRLAAAKRGA